MGDIKKSPALGRGAVWRRWDPHVHAPGTVLNDQYSGADPWGDFCAAINGRTPLIEAIGVTDYYSLATYERVVAAIAEGKIPACKFVFPNVEMRLNLGTASLQWLNLHLIVSPEKPDHVGETKRFLSRLTFRVKGDVYQCTPDDLMKLGRAHDANAKDAKRALEVGTEQFKVDFNQLKQEYESSDWAKENVLIAAAGGKDGTSGLKDGADAAIRQDIEKFAHIIFSSHPGTREFWLGQSSKITVEKLRAEYSGLKPCLHGSDGHTAAVAGAPALDRYTWIKGDLTFDALRQARIDPVNRTHIGTEPPPAANPSQVIAQVALNSTAWLKTPSLSLNPGLVAIIGARGSGKTALAEAIAAGCDALPKKKDTRAFLYRARDHLKGSTVTLNWQAGDPETRTLHFEPAPDEVQYERARYLSQQFVEGLCASDGMTSGLLREIERIVYEAHDVSTRDGAIDFADLLEMRASRHRQARKREETSLASLSEQIGTELEKHGQLESYKTQITEKTKGVEKYQNDRKGLVSKGNDAHVNRLTALSQAADRVRGFVRYFNIQGEQIATLQDEVADFRNNQAPESLRDVKDRHVDTGIKGESWNPFLTQFSGPVDDILKAALEYAKKQSAAWKGTTPPTKADVNESYLSDDAVPEKTALAFLEAEVARMEKLINIDKVSAEKYANLSKRITVENDQLEQLTKKRDDAAGAWERASGFVKDRSASYTRVFTAIVAEEAVLNELYAPIKERIATGSPTLQKLSFSVRRVADVAHWAAAGELLIDARRAGKLKGKGTLAEIAEELLRPAWETGDPAAVAAAMEAFQKEYSPELLKHSQVSKGQTAEYRSWSKRFAQWIYGTDHIAIHYSVSYDGIDIRNLSPGTRGIVLLLLYLALDDADDRPLIIDQPEENLDPKSIFDELVTLFIQAKSKRQVIMVTHNANLVINTDADQIIVASVGRHQGEGLPPITYTSGGLEDAAIRATVCDILEGGAEAFRERARRLRVHLDR